LKLLTYTQKDKWTWWFKRCT